MRRSTTIAMMTFFALMSRSRRGLHDRLLLGAASRSAARCNR